MSILGNHLANNKDYSQKYSILPLTTLLFRRIPLNLPFRCCLRVRRMMQRSSDLSLSLYTERTLPYVVVDFRELPTSHFRTNHILQLDRCDLQLIYSRSLSA